MDILDPLVGLNDTQRELYSTADAFAREHMAPFAGEWDAKKQFPEDTLRRLGSLGFGGLNVGLESGGCGLSRLDTITVLEALAGGCVSTTAYVSIHNMCARMIDLYATPALRDAWLPELVTFSKFASYCLTEPGAGSDAASLTTRAVYDPTSDCYVLRGNKAFISGGGRSDVYIVMARVEVDGVAQRGAGGISAFLVPCPSRGLSFGAQEKKMGWNSQPTAAVYLDGVTVPASHRLGPEGSGFKLALAALDGGRTSIAACSLGGAAAALRATLSYTSQRVQFGAPIASQQGVAFMLADAATQVHTSRVVLQHAARALDDAVGTPSRLPYASAHAAMAKKYVTDACLSAVNACVQMHGGYGYLADYGLERLLRDVRVHTILEGTNQIMNVITARALLAPVGR